MSRRIFLIGLTAVAVVAFGIGLYLSFAPAPAAPAPVAAPTPAPVTTPPPETTTPPPEPAPKPAAPPPISTAPAKPAAPAAAPTTATITFESDVPGASVFLDRVYLGTTPITVPNVKPGAHRLNASATGYDGIAENIEIVPGPRDMMLKFKEIRLDISVAVVHKHAIGSCTGKLIATPQGVKYDTTNEGDRFEAPLDGIAELELDYLGKKLRIKPKGGKNYTFAEVGGGADQLYAFHRDVEAARKKKTSGVFLRNP